MDPKRARPAGYGSLRPVVGRRHRVVPELADRHAPAEGLTCEGR